MNIVTMRTQTDCEVAAIATACGVSWTEAAEAVGWKNLPYSLENPIYGNPWNLYRALVGLGFWKKNVTKDMLMNGTCTPDRTIVLVKKSFTQQHWVVWGGVHHDTKHHMIYWGDKLEPRYLMDHELEKLFVESWPDCAFEVYPANFWQMLWARIKLFFRGNDE